MATEEEQRQSRLVKGAIEFYSKFNKKEPTNQEKSRVIAGKVGINLEEHILNDVKQHTYPLYIEEDKVFEGLCSCGFHSLLPEVMANHLIKHNPDFFTPEGQAVLAGALLGKENKDLLSRFDTWQGHNHKTHLWSPVCALTSCLKLVEGKETKLAELFYEFLESEKEK